MEHIKLGRYGFTVDPTMQDARQIEHLGFGTLWINGGQIDRLDVLTELLAATRQAAVAPAIIPVSYTHLTLPTTPYV